MIMFGFTITQEGQLEGILSLENLILPLKVKFFYDIRELITIYHVFVNQLTYIIFLLNEIPMLCLFWEFMYLLDQTPLNSS